jgi:protein-disulfide isomerase
MSDPQADRRLNKETSQRRRRSFFAHHQRCRLALASFIALIASRFEEFSLRVSCERATEARDDRGRRRWSLKPEWRAAWTLHQAVDVTLQNLDTQRGVTELWTWPQCGQKCAKEKHCDSGSPGLVEHGHLNRQLKPLRISSPTQSQGTQHMVRLFVGQLAKVFAGVALTSMLLNGSAIADSLPLIRIQSQAEDVPYELTDPRVLREVLKYTRKKNKLSHMKDMLRQNKDQLYKSGAPEVGPPGAKVTLVVFLDYNCPYCRSTYSAIKEFLKENPDTKLVVRDTAIFGKDSEGVGRIALASQNQGKFEQLHDALMAAKGKLGEKQALDIAANLGLDIPRLKEDASSPDVGAMLVASRDLSIKLEVPGTPAYIVGDHGIVGAPEDLIVHITRFVEEVRTSGCDVC